MSSWRPLLACALACGCGDAGSAGTSGTTDTTGTGTTGAPELDGTMVDLVKPTLWQPQPAADDPLPAHRPDTVDCQLGIGWLVEETGFEVNTGACNYASFVQPTLVPVVRGAQISLDFYHFDLVAPEPATAHIAVLVGDHVIFEREIAIPGKAGVYPVDLVADFELPAGAPAVVHLHNHGQNTWTVASLQVEVESP